MLKDNILLFAAHSAWGGASNFLDMFLRFGHKAYEINLEEPTRDGYSFRDDLRANKFIYDNQKISDLFDTTKSEDLTYFIFDVLGFQLFQRFCNKNLIGTDLRSLSINIFWSGNPYVVNHKRMNQISKKLDFKQYCMLDLLRFNKEALPLMQPYDIHQSPVFNKKFDSKKKIIMHSPGHKGSSNEKGTLDIDKFFEHKKYEYVKIGSSRLDHLRHSDCLSKKTLCDVFIDKIGPNSAGGLGKSGIEAICLGVPTICSMNNTIFSGRYSVLEDVVFSPRTVNDLSILLDEILESKEKYFQICKKNYQAAKVFNYENTYSYLNFTAK